MDAPFQGGIGPAPEYLPSKRILHIVGLVLLIAGFVIGYVPVSSQGVNCGSAIKESSDAFAADLGATLVGGDGNTTHDATCSSLRSIIRIPAVLLIVIGGLLLAIPLFWPQWFLRRQPGPRGP